MPMRVSGINSGLDTDAIVRELVSAYSKKTEKIEKDQTKLSWKQDIWKELNTKVYGLYTSVSNLRYSGAYGLRKVTSSNAAKATVTADGNSIIGSHKLNVLKTAQSAYLTGTKITTQSGTDVKSDTKLSDLGIQKDATLRVTTKDSDGNDVVKDLKVTKDSTMSDFVKQLQDAGLNASFDEGNSRLFVSSKNSGANGDFSIGIATDKQVPKFDSNDNVVKEVDANGVERVVYETVNTSAAERLASGNMLSFLGLNQSQALAGSNIKMKSTSVQLSQNTTMANLGYDNNGGNNAKIDVRDSDGSIIGSLNIGEFTTMKDIASQFKKMGINASFDIDASGSTKTGRFTFTGVSGLSFEAANDNGLFALDKLGLASGASTTRPTASNTTTLAELGWSGEDGTVIQYMSSASTEWKNITVNATDTIDDIIQKFDNDGISVTFTDGKLVFADQAIAFSATDRAGTDALSRLGLQTGGSSANAEVIRMHGSTAGASSTLIGDLGLTAGTSIKFTVGGIQKSVTIGETITIDATGAEVESGAATAAGSITVNTIDDLVNAFKARGLTNASYNSATGKFSFGAGVDITFSPVAIADPTLTDPAAINADLTTKTRNGNAMILALGLNGGSSLQEVDTRRATKIDGQDAEIRLNGEIFTSANNNFTINGLTINALGVTGDGDENAISINVSTDNQGIYDKVKDFLTQYNNIINEITKLYNADSSYGYDPLTDDEKESMSDAQIEKWETKIKDSLLRRDNTLSTLMSSMINAMNKSFTINGKNYNLTSFGIHTLGFLNAVKNEQNAFHIDGDAEDENTSGNKEMLMKAINEDPDTVIEFMKQLTSNLYKTIDDNMQSSSLRSRYKIYNDKEMDKQYTAYAKKIKEWEDRVSAKEDYYYKKFSKMESALAKLNSQTTSLTGLLGNNSR